MLYRKIITIEIPLSFLGSAAIMAWVFDGTRFGGSLFTGDPLFHLLSGGMILGAFFMATDYVTSPVTKKAKVIFGAGCGLITIFFRYFIGYPEGVAFAILIMNLFTWYFALPKKQLFVKLKPKCKVNKSTENHQPKNCLPHQMLYNL